MNLIKFLIALTQLLRLEITEENLHHQIKLGQIKLIKIKQDRNLLKYLQNLLWIQICFLILKKNQWSRKTIQNMLWEDLKIKVRLKKKRFNSAKKNNFKTQKFKRWIKS